jgi:hypothetical protein
MTAGTTAGPIAADADRPGFVVTAGADRAEADQRAADAIAALRWR